MMNNRMKRYLRSLKSEAKRKTVVFDKLIAAIRPGALLLTVLISTFFLSSLLLLAGSRLDDLAPAFGVVSGFMVAMMFVTRGVRPLGNAGLARAAAAETPDHLMPALKWPVEKKLIAQGINLNIGGPTVLGSQNVACPFPFGEGYRTLGMDVHITVTIGTGTGAIAEGELLFVRNVYHRTDKHGPIIDNVCGRALYYRARKLMKTAPYKDAIAATTGTYDASINFHYTNNRARRPEDTLLDMKDVKALELVITCGTVADFLTSPGTATVTATVDLWVEKTKKPIDEGAQPVFQPYVSMLGPVDPSVLQYLEVPKIPDLGFADIMLLATNGATAGVPWSGTVSDTTIARCTLEDNKGGKTFDNMLWKSLLNDNKVKFQFETRISGCVVFDVMEDDSVWSGYGAGDKAKLQVNWVNGTLSTSQVSALIDGMVSVKTKGGAIINA